MYLDIYEAIERRRLIQVYYGGYSRVVEPRIYGCDSRHVDVLKAYQIAGADELGRHIGWKWFTVSRIEAVLVLATRFTASRNEDGLRNRVLQRVYCQVSPSPFPTGDASGAGQYRRR